ncbi:unnamed protein product [Anisakis simplex]|uniref:Uncharacterized protein n=1 Tax=Anisakis simplex TaxID=6269 RepID=A0A0M3J899_ANISI|nr:unnamed protein product [Anisakis simplex]
MKRPDHAPLIIPSALTQPSSVTFQSWNEIKLRKRKRKTLAAAHISVQLVEHTGAPAGSRAGGGSDLISGSGGSTTAIQVTPQQQQQLVSASVTSQRIYNPNDIVALAEKIRESGEFVQGRAISRLSVIAEQMRFLRMVREFYLPVRASILLFCERISYRISHG